MGAKDMSFIHKVSFLAKWLIQSKHGLHPLQTHAFIPYQRFMQKPLLNASRSLTIKYHTFTGLWLMSTFTIKLPNWLTFSFMILIHVLSLLITTHSFKTYDLRIPIHSNHTIDHFKPINKHWISKPSIKPLDNISALFNQALYKLSTKIKTIN